jgi:galactose mutarotase-like enzyme
VIEATGFRGLRALRLVDDTVHLTVIPAWGGKIVEMVDRRRGREWLFENPAFSYERCGARLPAYGADYVGRFDVGGFDECFPTVGACLYPTAPWWGTELPDHGEVWSLPWETEEDGDVLRLTTHGVRLPYWLEKAIRLTGDGGIRFDYRASNPTPFPMPFLWSSHPLFAIRPGMRLELPATSMRVFSAPSFPAHHGDRIPWPRFDELDLGRVPRPDAGVAVKLFSPPLAEGWAELSDPLDGAAFCFEFDPQLVTHLGLWVNYGGWAGAPGADPYFNLGLEPSIGAPDTLDTAVHHWRAYGELPPHGSRSWWLQMTLS